MKQITVLLYIPAMKKYWSLINELKNNDIHTVWPGSIPLADQLQVFILICLKIIIGNSKNGRVMWLTLFVFKVITLKAINVNLYPAEFLKCNNPPSIFGTYQYHFLGKSKWKLESIGPGQIARMCRLTWLCTGDKG